MSTDDRARRDLMILRSMLARVRSMPTGDDDDSVCERMALRAEWDNDVEKVARLDASMRRGELSSERRDEAGAVAREITDLVPLMQERRYRLPDPDALARLAGAHS